MHMCGGVSFSAQVQQKHMSTPAPFEFQFVLLYMFFALAAEVYTLYLLEVGETSKVPNAHITKALVLLTIESFVLFRLSFEPHFSPEFCCFARAWPFMTFVFKAIYVAFCSVNLNSLDNDYDE